MQLRGRSLEPSSLARSDEPHKNRPCPFHHRRRGQLSKPKSGCEFDVKYCAFPALAPAPIPMSEISAQHFAARTASALVPQSRLLIRACDSRIWR